MIPLNQISPLLGLNSDVATATVKTSLNHENINLLLFFEPQQIANFTWTLLLLLSKAKVHKIICDQLAINMAARPMFGTRDKSVASSRLLTHCRCPERHVHNEILEIDILLPEPQLSAILILPVTLAPPSGFHASERRDIGPAAA